MPAFILAIFLSAFLLFQVQPIIARYILPWYGGSPAVWTTCMLFFQVGLLVGYTYAHLLVSSFRERPRWQAGIHLAILVVSLVLLPITPPESYKPTGAEASPVGGILLLLFVTVGLPYVIIAASGPLLQHWFGSVVHGRSPYRLYAISNFGSLLGLLTYPPLFEPHLRLAEQTGLWSGGYRVYAVLAVVCAWQFLRSRPQSQSKPQTVSEAEGIMATSESESDTPPTENSGDDDDIPSPAPWIDRVFWVALAACGSLLLLATTNQMCQDVAVVPFLWVLPLSLYLVTFIIAFDHARWYYRPFWIPLAAISIGSVVYLINQDYSANEIHISLQIAAYSLAMFSACMVCHGEMVRLKPHPRYLTGFYLAVSLGGAIGGLFVSLVAPRIFSGYWEFHIGLMTVALLAGLCLMRDFRRSAEAGSLRPSLVPTIGMTWILAMAVTGYFLKAHYLQVKSDAIISMRSFYGVLHVYEGDTDNSDHWRALYHGRINHGRQFLAPAHRRWAGGYYTAESGPGVLFQTHPARRDLENPDPLRFGVIGLGIGTLSAYALPGDTVRMYEINPQVEELARSHFTFLEDCEGDSVVAQGDARISLERELADGGSQQFDILFVDAFSGDSIPIHLLTREAFALYFQHLKEDGVLAVHITNWHLELSDPVRSLAREFGWEAIQIEHDPESWWANYSRWVIITNNRELLAAIDADGWSMPWESAKPREILWTDDYSNLFQVIDWD